MSIDVVTSCDACRNRFSEKVLDPTDHVELYMPEWLADENNKIHVCNECRKEGVSIKRPEEVLF